MIAFSVVRLIAFETVGKVNSLGELCTGRSALNERTPAHRYQERPMARLIHGARKNIIAASELRFTEYLAV